MSTSITQNFANMTLGENVKLLRTERGISQTELAQAIGVHHPRISEIERKKGNPTLETITKLAEFFGVSESFLLAPRKYQKTG